MYLLLRNRQQQRKHTCRSKRCPVRLQSACGARRRSNSSKRRHRNSSQVLTLQSGARRVPLQQADKAIICCSLQVNVCSNATQT